MCMSGTVERARSGVTAQAAEKGVGFECRACAHEQPSGPSETRERHAPNAPLSTKKQCFSWEGGEGGKTPLSTNW